MILKFIAYKVNQLWKNLFKKKIHSDSYGRKLYRINSMWFENIIIKISKVIKISIFINILNKANRQLCKPVISKSAFHLWI